MEKEYLVGYLIDTEDDNQVYSAMCVSAINAEEAKKQYMKDLEESIDYNDLLILSDNLDDFMEVYNRSLDFNN